MSHGKIYHALGLHMHQPPGNMRLLIESNEWEAVQIIHCYDRATRYAHKYLDFAKFHVGFSGVLLEQLRDPYIVDRYRQYMDIPAMLNSYREATNIELIGMGYYHPIFPLIPKEDWEDQLMMGRQIMEDTFGRAPKGFWPSEMAFTMEMIPALVKAGYEYVVVDSVHVKNEDGQSSVVDIYQPYKARHDGQTIVIIPRDRDISNAQESGLDPSWFANETQRKIGKNATEDRLLTTWSDGENGGWFRQLDEGSGFFGHFFAPYIEHARGGEFPVMPVALSEYITTHNPQQEVEVKTGAWNVGNTSGEDFSQWNGSASQQQAVQAIHELSERYREVKKGKRSAKAKTLLEQTHQLVLEAQTSCFLFWGDSWLPKLYERTGMANDLLDEVENHTPAPNKPEPVAQAEMPLARSDEKPADKPASESKTVVAKASKSSEVKSVKAAPTPSAKKTPSSTKEAAKPAPSASAQDESKPAAPSATKQSAKPASSLSAQDPSQPAAPSAQDKQSAKPAPSAPSQDESQPGPSTPATASGQSKAPKSASAATVKKPTTAKKTATRRTPRKKS